MKRTTLLLAAAALLLTPAAAFAQAKYPASAVTLVTHSSPGGGSDVFLREMIKHLQPIMGVNFAVENVSGGSGAKAMAKLGGSSPDGSIFYATTPTYIQTTLLSKPSVGYDALEPLVIVFLDPEVIYTRADSPHGTLKDAVEFAKKNPGKAKWGAANPASLERIALEQMKRKLGINAVVATHEGGGQAMINVLNGTLDLGIGEVQEIRAQLEAKKVRLLGVLTEKRLEQFPYVATAKEQGVDMVVTKFRGLAGPKGLKKDVIAAWEAGIQKVLASPAYKKVYEKDSLVANYMGHDQAVKFTAAFAKDVEASLKEFGIAKK